MTKFYACTFFQSENNSVDAFALSNGRSIFAHKKTQGKLIMEQTDFMEKS